MKYILMRDEKPVGIFDSSPEAMERAEELRKACGWFTLDLAPPVHRFHTPNYTVYGIFEDGD